MALHLRDYGLGDEFADEGADGGYVGVGDVGGGVCYVVCGFWYSVRLNSRAYSVRQKYTSLLYLC